MLLIFSSISIMRPILEKKNFKKDLLGYLTKFHRDSHQKDFKKMQRKVK